MEKVVKRISLLRQLMHENKIKTYMIPCTDPHASEYVADYWKEREWISGFDGSAGTVVITMDKAALWTDSRYFLQAEEQLKGTGIELMKEGLTETPGIITWIISQLGNNEKVGINSQMISCNAYSSMKEELKMNNIELVSVDLISKIWTDRPSLPIDPFYEYDIKFAGKSATNKINSVRQQMKQINVEVFLLSALDEIAWLFNIRGNDVAYNPVVIAYGVIELDRAILFVNPLKVTTKSSKYLQSEGIIVEPYEEIYSYLKQLAPQQSIWMDGAKLNQSVYEAIPAHCKIINKTSPVIYMKSIKNKTEIAGIKQAMIKDGIALVHFFKWLEENVGENYLTELSVSEQLHHFREEQENFRGESFETIVGYASHGAIVHYQPTTETNFSIKQENLLLIDSGGQYLEGTTDITRTISLGNPTNQQKKDFTLVLKGHIALAQVKFPKGTRGSQIDIMARQFLWKKGINYGHGTGHGVGHFLCVHEGPQNIRMDENPTTLEPGMLISNEPGVYRAGEYGIRTENLVLVTFAKKTDFGEFYQFETLSLCPIDKSLIDKDMLTENEINWLNNYHQKVFEILSLFLNEEERKWLQQKCLPL